VKQFDSTGLQNLLTLVTAFIEQHLAEDGQFYCCTEQARIAAHTVQGPRPLIVNYTPQKGLILFIPIRYKLSCFSFRQEDW